MLAHNATHCGIVVDTFASQGSDIAEKKVSSGIGRILYPSLDPLAGAPQVIAARGNGIRIETVDGKSYLDACAGLWCAALGFSNHRLAEAAYKQLKELPYYHSFAGKTHAKAIELAQRLIALAPAPMEKVFFANSGSEANDTTIKLIWYYNNAIGRPEKKKIITRRHSYHGVTIGTTSLTGIPTFHEAFDAPLPRFLRTVCPNYYHDALPGESEEAFASRCANELDALIVGEGPDTVAAMFIDPVMGGAGVIVPSRAYHEKISAVLIRHNVLLVADEVISGFGRTGCYWGSQAFGLKPDMLTCAKALSAAYMPISALMISKPIADVISEQAHRIGAFFNGFTYSGHSVAAAVALEALQIYDEMKIEVQARERGAALMEAIHDAFDTHPHVGHIRGIGLLASFEFVADKVSHRNFPAARKLGAQFADLCRDEGMLVRANLNDTIALCPPITITPEEIREMVDILQRALARLIDGMSRASG